MSSKLPQTTYPIHDLLVKRWSPSIFADIPIDQDTLLALLEAARWAPSCFNEQPWFFIVASKDNTAQYERLFGCLVEANQKWASTAPVLMLSVAKLHFDRNGKPNRHAQHDVGLAAENLVIEAMSRDIYVHQMGGFDADKARSVFQIPEGYEPMAAMAIGYKGATEQAPEDLVKRESGERTRKKLGDFIFGGKWGEKLIP